MMIVKIILAFLFFYCAWQISNPYHTRKRWKENTLTFAILAALLALVAAIILPLLKP